MRQCVWSFPTLCAEWKTKLYPLYPCFPIMKTAIQFCCHKILLYNTVKKLWNCTLLKGKIWLMNWIWSSSIIVIIIIIILSYFSTHFKLIFAHVIGFKIHLLMHFSTFLHSSSSFFAPASQNVMILVQLSQSVSISEVAARWVYSRSQIGNRVSILRLKRQKCTM